MIIILLNGELINISIAKQPIHRTCAVQKLRFVKAKAVKSKSKYNIKFLADFVGYYIPNRVGFFYSLLCNIMIIIYYNRYMQYSSR